MAGRVFTRSAKDPEFQSRSSHNYSLATNGSQYKKTHCGEVGKFVYSLRKNTENSWTKLKSPGKCSLSQRKTLGSSPGRATIFHLLHFVL